MAKRIHLLCASALLSVAVSAQEAVTNAELYETRGGDLTVTWDARRMAANGLTAPGTESRFAVRADSGVQFAAGNGRFKALLRGTVTATGDVSIGLPSGGSATVASGAVDGYSPA